MSGTPKYAGVCEQSFAPPAFRAGSASVLQETNARRILVSNRMRRGLAAFSVVGSIAGAALWLGTALGLLTWMLFLAWVAYGLLGGSPRAGLRLLAALVAGAAAGWAVVALGAASETALGDAAMPVALGLACGALAVLDEVPPLDIVPGYFFGMIAFFAAGAAPGAATVAAIALPAALGIGCGWLAAALRALATNRRRAGDTAIGGHDDRIV